MSSIRTFMTAVLMLALCLLAGCATPQDPMSVVSVTPDSVIIGDAARITVSVDGLHLPSVGGEPRLAGVEIQACGVSLTDLEFGEVDRQAIAVAPGGSQVLFTGGSISGVVPAEAEPGTSDVVVSAPNSGSGISIGAIECIQPETDEPEEPDQPDQPDEPEEPLDPALTIEPQQTDLIAGQSYQFSATVQNLENDLVNWSLSGVGTLDDPDANPVKFRSDEEGQATLVVTSVARPELSASLSLDVAYPDLTVTISPDVAKIYPQQEQVFTATVNGWDNTDVTWEVSPEP